MKVSKSLVSVVLLALCLCLSACANRMPPASVETSMALFADARFQPPSVAIVAADIFTLDTPMRQYLQQQLQLSSQDSNKRYVLVDALFNSGKLMLDYDAATTRNARETFHARAGNCLSLTIMAAAFARELGLSVFFQEVNSDRLWSRQVDLQFSVGHVNLVVGERKSNTGSRLGENAMHTIDFMRLSENQLLATKVISEQTIVAMFMNNRSAEMLAAGDINQAYWYAREAVLQDANFAAGYITLGVIYRRHGQRQLAERVLTHVLLHEPTNTHAMSNLIMLLNADGREAESQIWQQKLTAAQPIAPFYYLDLGKHALARGEYRAARDYFLRELNRGTGSFNHEVHFWLANVYYRLGEYQQTKNHLDNAVDYSPTRQTRALYSAKRDTLNSLKAAQHDLKSISQ
jgi:tetratricopeptide (TPR) repeat protein